MEVEVQSPLGIAILIGIVISIIKNFIDIDTKWYPLIAIAFGIGYYTYFIGQGFCNIMYAVENGIVAGGAASGLYRAGKVLGGDDNKTVDAILNPLTTGRLNNNPINRIFTKGEDNEPR